MRAGVPSSDLLRLPLAAGLATGVLVGALLSSGCAPNSSGSPPSADTTTAVPDPAPSGTDRPDAARSPSPSPSDTPRSVAQRLADASVEARIKQALVRERELRVFDFTPEVVRGRVTLRGDVNTREQYRLAERIVRTVEGVTSLTNRLTVKGVSFSEANAAAAPTAVYHVVREGETLWEIAREYEVPAYQIRAFNPHFPHPPGERIRVR